MSVRVHVAFGVGRDRAALTVYDMRLAAKEPRFLTDCQASLDRAVGVVETSLG